MSCSLSNPPLPARIILDCATEDGPDVTGVTEVDQFIRAGEVDPRGQRGEKWPLNARKARSDGVSDSGLRAAPGLGLSSDSLPPPAVMGPGVGPFRVEIESELHR